LAAQFGSNFQNPSALGGLPIPVQTRILLGHEFTPSPCDSKSLLKEEKNGPYTIFLTATATAKIISMIGTQCFCTCPLGATTIPAAATTSSQKDVADPTVGAWCCLDGWNPLKGPEMQRLSWPGLGKC
jgi:hypothetical protein